MGFLSKFFSRNTEAKADIPDLSDELQLSRQARNDILETRDAFVRDGEAEQARQQRIRTNIRGEFLMDDLFGPNTNGGRP